MGGIVLDEDRAANAGKNLSSADLLSDHPPLSVERETHFTARGQGLDLIQCAHADVRTVRGSRIVACSRIGTIELMAYRLLE